MRARLEALLLSVLLIAACTPETAGAPPATSRPSDVPTAAANVAVPASRWHVVLIAGDNDSPAFDNGVRTMRDKLASRGVRDIQAFTSNPAANPSLPVATAANVSGALRGGGTGPHEAKQGGGGEPGAHRVSRKKLPDDVTAVKRSRVETGTAARSRSGNGTLSVTESGRSSTISGTQLFWPIRHLIERRRAEIVSHDVA